MNNIFKDKKIMAIISLAASFILWLTVSLILRPTGEVVVQGVGVNVNVQSGILAELGLSAIEGAENTVNVTISGSRSVIGGVSAEDISISPSLSGVSGAGIYELELKATKNSSKDFEIVGISPEKMVVKFDKYVDKTIDVFYVINGEYNIPDELIQEEIYTDPKNVVITGPEIDVAKIDGAVVEVFLSGDYDSTIAAVGELVLVDENKNPVDYNKNEISINTEVATVYIPVHKSANLPLSFDYINVPEYFDISNIHYTLSATDVAVEAEDYIIDKYSDIFLGYVDVRNITLENPSISFDVRLPDGIGATEPIDKVDIVFDLEGYVESTFNATQINIINVPAEYKVTSNASKIPVTLIGPEEVINGISAKDIVVQIDMSTKEITQTGQYRVQAEVFLPGGQNAWATGSYTATITVKAK
ncbi:MAG: hypothetical protein IJO22_08125 [Oscillospiraceae bacterium]|nr:hypothetical protein [Oscillospiraceae bacterium]